MRVYLKSFEKTKCISLMIRDDELLKKCNEMRGKISNTIKKEFISKPVYNEKYLKAI